MPIFGRRTDGVGDVLAIEIDASRIAFSKRRMILCDECEPVSLSLGHYSLALESKSFPGGCAIGVRPIDQHLKGLEALSRSREKGIYCTVDQLKGRN